ncbi:MAG TPA: hypothetical protein DCQ14_02835 [Firmicutes bacterium]|nr:hypothetical protein [Bacillota bacterium]
MPAASPQKVKREKGLNHIISYSGFREPLDNKDCFQVLQENGIISADLTDRLKRMAQFRKLKFTELTLTLKYFAYAGLQPGKAI